jgi:hypothetical protein
MRAIYLAFVLPTICVISEGSAEPNKDQYELQERCGKRAEEVFNRDHATKNNLTADSAYSYQSHYSATLNKCFYLEIVTSNLKSPEGSEGISTIMTLSDLNEHKEYGTFYMKGGYRFEGYGTFVGTVYSAPFPCKWNEQHKACHSASEWREWLKPYMEE